MSTRVLTADCRNIATPAALQVYLGYVLRAPSWYGENLDALYDILTECARPTRLVLRMPQAGNAEMAAYLPRLRRVLDDAHQACPAFEWAEA